MARAVQEVQVVDREVQEDHQVEVAPGLQVDHPDVKLSFIWVRQDPFPKNQKLILL